MRESSTRKRLQDSTKMFLYPFFNLFSAQQLFQGDALAKKQYLQEGSCKNNVDGVVESHRIHHSHLISLSERGLYSSSNTKQCIPFR